MSDTVMLVMVDTIDNNNKFYELSTLTDGRVQARYGRVGGHETIKIYPAGSFQKKKNEKIRKGYVVRETASSVTASTSGKRPNGGDDAVVKSLFGKDFTASNASFIKGLIADNRHAIFDASGGKITVNDSGQVTTALGPVTESQLREARTLLSLFKNNKRNRGDVEKYLTLIPQRINNTRDIDGFMTGHWFFNQDELLDALDAALAANSPGAGDGADADRDLGFRHFLTEVDSSSDEFKHISERFKKTMNSNHAAAVYKLSRVWKLDDDKSAAWDKSKSALKHTRTMWHGTTAGNVLSILHAGLICPPSTDSKFGISGRMFGDGVYFSDQSTKSLNYAIGVWNKSVGNSNPMMFLADVVMGREYRPTTHSWDIARAARTSKDDKGRNYNSIFVRGGTCSVRNNEMIVWKSEQIKLTYLCEFSR